MRRPQKRLELRTTITLVGAMLAIAAASAAQVEPPEQAGAETAAATSAARVDSLPAEGIADAVEHQLIVDPGVDSTRIDITVDAGIVTLDGSVRDILSADRATRVAETVRGVRGVVNLVEVRCPERADAAIASDVQDAFVRDPVTDSYEIDVTASEGIVTLRGTVESYTERDFVSRVAKRVKGVRGVANLLIVSPPVVRVDGEIAAEIRERMRWDRLVDHHAIEVVVKDGIVTVKGMVPSMAERRRARIDCYVSGVKMVRADDLVVDPLLTDPSPAEKEIDVTDEAVEEAVNDALFYDPRVASSNVDVNSAYGLVTLRGEVRDLRAKRSAADDARSVEGVFHVRNHLKVRPVQERIDDRISLAVGAALAVDPILQDCDIDIDVDDGVVTMSGEVNDFFEKCRAESLAAGCKSVVDVRNRLDVAYGIPRIGYSPYVDDWYLYDFGWYRPGRDDSRDFDWQIERDIEDELFWSPFVNEENVAVEVEGGVATLTGSVSDWGEFRAARENAYEGGAARVINKLEIAKGGSSF